MPELIDSLAIKYSGNCRQTVVPLNTSPPSNSELGRYNQQHVITELHKLLTGCGWTADGEKATGSVSFPLGYVYAIPGPPSGEIAGCHYRPIILIGDVGFSTYDPKDTPDPAATCKMVPLGTTVLGSMENLATAITAYTPFNATAETPTGPGYTITLEAKLGGPAFNHWAIDGDGGWAVGSGASQGGGYAFTSVEQAYTSQFSVKVTSRSNVFLPHRLQFDFTLNSGADEGTAQYLLDVYNAGAPIEQYTLIANPYSFGLFDLTTDLVFPYSLRQTSLWVAAPYIPVEEHDYQAVYAVFVVGPHQLRTHTYWDGSLGGVTTCLGAAPNTFGASAYTRSGYPRILAVRSPNETLNTPAGKPLVSSAWLMMGPSRDAVPTVVGQLWDCAVVNEEIAGGFQVQGKNFTKLSSQSGATSETRSSLMMCIG